MPKTLMTDDRVAIFLDAVEKGADNKTAASAAGWSEKTLYRYLETNPDLEEKLEKAKASIAMKAVQSIVENFDNWRVAAWFLERRCPEWRIANPKPVAEPEEVETTSIEVPEL